VLIKNDEQIRSKIQGFLLTFLLLLSVPYIQQKNIKNKMKEKEMKKKEKASTSIR
jgi:hypothetical protein